LARHSAELIGVQAPLAAVVDFGSAATAAMAQAAAPTMAREANTRRICFTTHLHDDG
jgi:hypothetical protein